LARGVLLAAVPALGLALLTDLLLHGQQPLLEILRARGWIYVVLGGVTATAYVKRRSWLEALDRRFFRERYDAQRLLREVVEEVRRRCIPNSRDCWCASRANPSIKVWRWLRRDTLFRYCPPRVN